MRTLYLHIGFHKTGSSSLQLALLKKKTELQKAGWEFISLDGAGNSSAFIKLSEESPVNYSISSKLYTYLASSSQNNVVLSGEHFSFLNSLNELKRLKKGALKYFNNIKIVVYLRRQDKLALSFKQQAAKNSKAGLMPSSKLCGHSISALPDLNQDIKEYLDFNKKVKLWESCFGGDALIVRLFEEKYLINGDICLDFSKVVNLPVPLESLRINEGINRLQSLYTHCLLDLNVHPDLIKHVRTKLPADKKKVLPTQVEALKFYDVFKESNEALFKRLNMRDNFDLDFSTYPIKSEYKMTKNEAKFLFDEIVSFYRKNNELMPENTDLVRDSAFLLNGPGIAINYKLYSFLYKVGEIVKAIKKLTIRFIYMLITRLK